MGRVIMLGGSGGLSAEQRAKLEAGIVSDEAGVDPVFTVWAGDSTALAAVSNSLQNCIALETTQLFRVQRVAANISTAAVNAALPIPVDAAKSLLIPCTPRYGEVAGPVTGVICDFLRETLCRYSLASNTAVTFDPTSDRATQDAVTRVAAQVMTPLMDSTHPYYVRRLPIQTVTVTGTNTEATLDVSALGLTTAQWKKATCRALFSGGVAQASRRMKAIAWLSAPGTLRVRAPQPSSGQTCTVDVQITIWEGSAWKVHHGYAASGASTADTIDLALRDEPPSSVAFTAAGNASSVAAWNKAMIWALGFSGQSLEATAGKITTDTCPIPKPGGGDGSQLGQVRCEFSSAHDNDNEFFYAWVVEDIGTGGMLVTRFDTTATASGTTAIDVTSAALRTPEEAIVLGYTNTTKLGGGTDGFHFGLVDWALTSATNLDMIREFTELGTFSGRFEVVRLPEAV